MTPNEITTVIGIPFGRQFDTGWKHAIFEKVKTWRSRLIANSLERNPQDRIFFSQTFEVPMENAEGYSISSVDVPRPLESSRMYYDYVGNGGPIAFVYAPAGSGLLSAGQYTLTPTFDIVNKRLVVDREGICKVIIRGIMDDPQQELCDCQSVSYWDTDYPLTNKISQQIIQAISDELKQTTPPANKEGHLAVPAEEGRV